MSLRRRLQRTTRRARLTGRPDGPLLITSAANAESQTCWSVFFLVFVFFLHYYFLNRRNNRRRPPPDNSSGVIRRFPFRSRSLVSVSESIIITLVDANKRVLSFSFLYYFFFLFIFFSIISPPPGPFVFFYFSQKRVHRSPVSGTHARLHCFRPHTTPAPPPIIARGARRRPAQQSDSAMTATLRRHGVVRSRCGKANHVNHASNTIRLEGRPPATSPGPK